MPLPDFTQLNFADKQTLQICQSEAARIIEYDITDEASKLWRTIANAFPTVTDQNLARAYQVLIQDLGWVILPVLPEAQRFALFRGSFRRAIEMRTQMENVLTRLVYTIPTLIWLEVATQYLQQLRQNTEQLGSKTLGSWFSDFQRTMPDRKPTDLDVMRYLNQDPAAKSLTPEERALLLKAFQYYIGLTPLSLAEIEPYVTQEERDAYNQQVQQLSAATQKLQEMQQFGALPAPLVKSEILQNPTARERVSAINENPRRAPAPFLSPRQEQQLEYTPLPRPSRPLPPPATLPSRELVPPVAPAPVSAQTDDVPPQFRKFPAPPPITFSPEFLAKNAQKKDAPKPSEPPQPPAADPFMPHKPRPVPRVEGNIVDLKRK